MIYIFLAEGFEECEATAPLDILRRAGIEIKTVGIDSKTVTGAHGITVVCDLEENEADFEKLEGIILPGGMPGTLNLEYSRTVQSFVDFAYTNGLLIGAICAAPSILGHKGMLSGKKATCFGGFEASLKGAEVVNEPCVTDRNIVTAYGAGAAFDFGFALVSYLKGEAFSDGLRREMRYERKPI